MRRPIAQTRQTYRPLQAPARRAHDPQRVRRPTAGYRGIIGTVVLVLLSWISGTPGLAKEISKEQMQGLDEQVQEIKSDVLSMATELRSLEEKLLFPSSTQIAVFVTLAEGETFRLDSVQVKIDDQVVAHHIYSFKELEALQKGGVQRIYTGNVPTGQHRLEVSVAGKQPGGGDFSGSESFTFSKEVEPKLVGITLAGGGSSIQLGGW